MSGSNSGIPCDGWWHQELFGRQPMDDLRLKFDGGGISGSGITVSNSTITGNYAQKAAVFIQMT